MRMIAYLLLGGVVGSTAPALRDGLLAQDAYTVVPGANTSALIVGHPFSAMKFARRIKVLPDGREQFLRNERYPTLIARDSSGRLMMQVVHKDELQGCDQLDLLNPPPCPMWNVFVIDPVSSKVIHWPGGETAAHDAIELPLTPTRLADVATATSNSPVLGPGFSDEDGKVTKEDLGSRRIEGIPAHGVRWTLRYQSHEGARIEQRTRIHEEWASPEMQLIVRVIDGDPKGQETRWGLEKISVSPAPDLFRPPNGYKTYHRNSDHWEGQDLVAEDFEDLKAWFDE
jgi:hypothetical protein